MNCSRWDSIRCTRFSCQCQSVWLSRFSSPNQSSFSESSGGDVDRGRNTFNRRCLDLSLPNGLPTNLCKSGQPCFWVICEVVEMAGFDGCPDLHRFLSRRAGTSEKTAAFCYTRDAANVGQRIALLCNGTSHINDWM